MSLLLLTVSLFLLTVNLFRLTLTFFLCFRPAVTQAHNTVHHDMFRGAVQIGYEIPLTQELEVVARFRRFESRFPFTLHYYQGIWIKLF